jgi:GTP cyclohydrolase I
VSTVDLPDIQRTHPEHCLAINWVGVRDLRSPLEVEIDGRATATVATLSLAVALNSNERGTHMSRFVEEIAAFDRPLSASSVADLLRDLAGRLDARSARIDASFPFFLRRQAPVSGSEALVDYEGRVRAVLDDGIAVVTLGVRVPVTSLCPCSKEISDYGAHSQRGYVSIDVRIGDGRLDLADLVTVAEDAASAPIYALLKREDERHVTMTAYDKPAFVEDIARSVAMALSKDPRAASFSVDVENQESIHSHSAWAQILSSP